MKTLRFLILAILLTTLVGAEERQHEKLLDYEGVTVREVHKDRIRVMHKSGFATIPIEELPNEVRENLGMSMDGIEDYRENRAEKEAEQARKARVAAANKKILADAYLRIEHAEVFQVIDGGVLAHVTSTWDGTYRNVDQHETKSYRVGNALSGYRTEKRKEFVGTKKVKNTSYHNDWLIFVSCDNSGLVDGSRFEGGVWDAGTFSYTTAIGGGKTIPKYTTNPEDITINR